MEGQLEIVPDHIRTIFIPKADKGSLQLRIEGDGFYRPSGKNGEWNGTPYFDIEGSEQNDHVTVNNLATFGVTFKGGKGDDIVEANGILHIVFL